MVLPHQGSKEGALAAAIAIAATASRSCTGAVAVAPPPLKYPQAYWPYYYDENKDTDLKIKYFPCFQVLLNFNDIVTTTTTASVIASKI